MTLNEFIEGAFKTEHEYLMDALGDITPEELHRLDPLAHDPSRRYVVPILHSASA